MTYRALELLNMPPDQPGYLLDIGCGSGLSGQILDDEGYIWAGVDIAPSMLGETCDCYSYCSSANIFITEVALEREVEGDLFLQDIGQGFGFRPGSFDGAIRHVATTLAISSLYVKTLFIDTSISVLQWLLNAETSHPTSSPPHRLNRFFTTLHSAMRNPSRVVLQFYPSSDDQIQLITSIAQKAGFGGGIVIDYPNSKKARKVFLCLFVGGGGGQQQVPQGLQGDEEEDDKVTFERRRDRERTRAKNVKRKNVKDKNWILKKKEVIPNLCSYMILLRTHLSRHSSTANVARRECLMTRDSQVVNESQFSKVPVHRSRVNHYIFSSMRHKYCEIHVRRFTKRLRDCARASWAF